MNQISIVTVVMNRTEHLLQQTRAVSLLRGHEQHVILDLGSTKPIRRDQLPRDERIQLHRVESPNGRWWLTHSYNLAFALATGDYILKLDADILPSQRFMDLLSEQQVTTNAHLMCNRLTLQDWSLEPRLFTTNGLFLAKKNSLACIKGFNPYIQGWGWDEIDLYGRFFMAGYSVSRIPQQGVELIAHSDCNREPMARQITKIAAFNGSRLDSRGELRTRLEVQNEKNKEIAVRSIRDSVDWPSFKIYRDVYSECKTLPSLPKIRLFGNKERALAERTMRNKLLGPWRFEDKTWNLIKKAGIGPYTIPNTRRILEAYNISLDLVA